MAAVVCSIQESSHHAFLSSAPSPARRFSGDQSSPEAPFHLASPPQTRQHLPAAAPQHGQQLLGRGVSAAGSISPPLDEKPRGRSVLDAPSSLRSPQQIKVDALFDVATELQQEFEEEQHDFVRTTRVTIAGPATPTPQRRSPVG